MLILALRIQVKIGGCAGQAVGDHIVPGIAVQVVNERKEIVGGVSVFLSLRTFEPENFFLGTIFFFEDEGCFRRIDFVALREGGSFPPVGTRDRVAETVFVEVAEVGAFTPVVLVEMKFFEDVESFVRCGDGEAGDQ